MERWKQRCGVFTMEELQAMACAHMYCTALPSVHLGISAPSSGHLPNGSSHCLSHSHFAAVAHASEDGGQAPCTACACTRIYTRSPEGQKRMKGISSLRAPPPIYSMLSTGINASMDDALDVLDEMDIRKDYYQDGNHVYSELDVHDAFQKALNTWANWVDSNVNPKKTTLFSEPETPTTGVDCKGPSWQ